jgi:hypothetical protein
MSKLPEKKETLPEPTTDIGEGDMNRLTAFLEAGLPGIVNLTQEKINDMLELYMDGASYSSLAMDMKVKKELVLYAAYKGDWFAVRKDHLAELSSQLAQTVAATKIRNRITMKKAIDHKRRILDDLIGYYNRTRDRITKEEIDKETMAYAKLVEQYEKLESDESNKAPKTPPFGLQVGATGVKITNNQTGQSVDVTPKKESPGAALERMAEEEREEERRKKNEKIVDSTDIKEEN